MSEILRAQLYALRAQLDAIILSVDSQAVQTMARAQSGACPQCGAPEEKQVDAGTLAAPGLKKCLVCQVEYSG